MSKVQIGSRYDGPPLDRPSLRRLPPGWYLTIEDDKPRIPWLNITLWALLIWISLEAITIAGKLWS